MLANGLLVSRGVGRKAVFMAGSRDSWSQQCHMPHRGSLPYYSAVTSQRRGTEDGGGACWARQAFDSQAAGGGWWADQSWGERAGGGRGLNEGKAPGPCLQGGWTDK